MNSTPTDDIDIDVVEEDTPPPPAGSPARFREFLALSLKTTDPAVLAQAEKDYRGVHASVHDFVATELAGHLPPELDWLPSACDPNRLVIGYEAQVGCIVWAIDLRDSRVMVFESPRKTGP